MGPLQASPDAQQDLGPCLDTLVVPLLPGPVTQVLRTTTEICDGNSKQHPMVKTRAAPLSCASRARKVVQAFPRGSLKEFQNRRKSTKSNARAAARRLELSMPPKPCASDSWHNSRMMALRYSVDSSFRNDTGTILVRHSKTEESRDVGRRFGPPRRVLNERLRTESIDNENFVPSIDVCSQTLNVADGKIKLFFQPSDLLLPLITTFSPSLQAHTYHIGHLRFWNKLLVLPLMKPKKTRDVAV